ncbi:1,4-dihydroxy-2-naphthoate octaprenyltransferase [Bifidobacterium callitrichos]|uniref:1,4-dihydroxy-2-naphthoate octaprenyltransferase n=2 Tax=Bifidobacterium callitrichos TaxID=762209 RepID=A0A2T3GBW7_9BIFI|nr:1,4-dihydroxy-2-naphthoate octaprenyltransferase [Bifidobacterium callitrichos]
MRSMGLWIQGARPKTLPLAISPVVAASMAMWPTVFEGVWGGSYLHRPCPVIGGRPSFDPNGDYGQCLTSPGWYAAVTLLCVGVALFLQIAANFANDYADGVRGTDDARGGEESATGKPQRLTASGLIPAKHVLAAAGVSAALACVWGLAIAVLTGHWWFIALGLVCLAAGWYYVGGRHPYGYHGWGEVSVFVFFGLVTTCGTSYALSDEVPFLVVWTAVALGLIAVGVLCVNNLRDIDDDAAHGKRTWMVRLGRERGTAFSSAMPIAAVAMLALAYMSRNPLIRVAWMAADPMCGMTGDGRTVCTGVSWIDIVLAAASTAMLVVAIVLCIRLRGGLRGRRYRSALPMASMLSPALALGFGFLYLMGA